MLRFLYRGRAANVVGGSLAILAVITFVARLVMRVRDGRALETYANALGQSTTAIEALALLAVLLAVGVATLFITRRPRRHKSKA